MANRMGTGWTMLVAEDDETARFFMKRAFDKMQTKSTLRFVADGVQAIEYLDGRGKYADREEYPFPSVLVVDIKMPKLDGFGLLEWIKAHEKLKCLVVVVLTSSDEPIDINRAYSLGANSYLVKTALYPEFTELVKCMDMYWMKCNRPPLVEPEWDELKSIVERKDLESGLDKDGTAG